VADGVFLFQGVSSGQRAEPFAGAPERGTTLARIVPWRDASRQFAGAPVDRAIRAANESAERCDAMHSDECVGILGIAETPRVKDTESWRFA